jgi:hypothetical protein
LEPSHSNIVAIDVPDESYRLRVQLEDPVNGYLIDLYYQNTRLARTVVDDRETAGQIAAELAAVAPELREFNERPRLGPERINRVEIEAKQESSPTPDEWSGQENEWKTSSRTRTTTPKSRAQRDHSLRKPSMGVTTTICNGVREIPSPHSTSHLPPLLNDNPIPDTTTTAPKVRKSIRHDSAVSTG